MTEGDILVEGVETVGRAAEAALSYVGEDAGRRVPRWPAADIDGHRIWRRVVFVSMERYQAADGDMSVFRFRVEQLP